MTGAYPPEVENLPIRSLPSQEIVVSSGVNRLRPPAGATHATLIVRRGSILAGFLNLEQAPSLYAVEEGLQVSGAQLADLRFTSAPGEAEPPRLTVDFWQAVGTVFPPRFPNPTGNGRISLTEYARQAGLNAQGSAYLGESFDLKERYPEEWQALLAALLAVPETAWLAGTITGGGSLPVVTTGGSALDTLPGSGVLTRENGALAFVRLLAGDDTLLPGLLPGFASAPDGSRMVKRGSAVTWETPRSTLSGTRAERRALTPPPADLTEYRETDTGMSLTYYTSKGWRTALGGDPDTAVPTTPVVTAPDTGAY